MPDRINRIARHAQCSNCGDSPRWVDRSISRQVELRSPRRRTETRNDALATHPMTAQPLDPSTCPQATLTRG